MPAGFIDYRVVVSHDEETGQTVAEIPALGIADDGSDANTALDNLCQMATFHLECLLDEGEQVPESDEGEGVYIRVQVPVRAAQTAPTT